MFVSREIYHAAPAKTLALREVLLRAVRSGEPVVVAQRLWGQVPLFTRLRAFDSLNAYEEWRQGWKPNPEVAKQFEAALAAAPASELWEVPGQSVGSGGAVGRFSVRGTFHAANGKLPELRKAIEQRVATATAAGLRRNLWLRVSGGPATVSLVSSYEHLGDFEKIRAAAMTDATLQAANQALTALLAAPVETPDFFEIIARPQ